MADCDSVESAEYSIDCGADLIGTTLAGYTESRAATVGPDLDLVKTLAEKFPGLVVAEGRYESAEQVERTSAPHRRALGQYLIPTRRPAR